MDLMLDIETLGATPDTTILTVAAQSFDPLGRGYFEHHYYARVDLESQPNRTVNDGTVEWWSRQPPHAQEEAFGEADRVPLPEVLDGLTRLVMKCNRLWVNGVGFDTTILEHAYRENERVAPWQYFNVRDVRTVLKLWPDLPTPATSHHALEDCKRQIDMLQDTLRHLGVREMR